MEGPLTTPSAHLDGDHIGAHQSATTRRLTGLAIAAAVFATVVLFLVASGGEGGDSDDNGWILGLVIILGPVIFASATHSVASSSLLRPVGAIMVLLCSGASAVHVGLAVDRQAALGWVYGVPAIATPVLLLAAVIRGPALRAHSRPPLDTTTEAAFTTQTPVSGPPLDVTTPLRDARSHAARSGLAWVIVLVFTVATVVPLLRLLGWPMVVAELDAQVVEVREVADGTEVTFEAPRGGDDFRWTRAYDDPSWEVGDRFVGYLDEEGEVHVAQQFGLAGIPLLMPFFLIAVFGGFAVRRLWGLTIAWVDVHRTADAPRLGYAAVIKDPAPKTWRPLLAVWDSDPSAAVRPAKPDAVYRADDETGEDLMCFASDLVIRRAWIDTGAWDGAKPRWVGFEDGVAIPHRRVLFGRWYVRTITRRSDVAEVVELHHGPPDPRYQPLQNPTPSRHRLPSMVAWRLLAPALGVGLAFIA